MKYIFLKLPRGKGKHSPIVIQSERQLTSSQIWDFTSKGPLKLYYIFLGQSNLSSIYLRDCTPDEIRNIKAELENIKASDIPVKIIKNSSRSISPFLIKHINNSMANDIYPDILKIGEIAPVYKKDDKELFKNYRPVW